jgi:hypothetical protein
MGIPNEPFICPSLALGIRRAYLESLDRHWAIFNACEKSDALRAPYLPSRICAWPPAAKKRGSC